MPPPPSVGVESVHIFFPVLVASVNAFSPHSASTISRMLSVRFPRRPLRSSLVQNSSRPGGPPPLVFPLRLPISTYHLVLSLTPTAVNTHVSVSFRFPSSSCPGSGSSRRCSRSCFPPRRAFTSVAAPGVPACFSFAGVVGLVVRRLGVALRRPPPRRRPPSPRCVSTVPPWVSPPSFRPPWCALLIRAHSPLVSVASSFQSSGVSAVASLVPRSRWLVSAFRACSLSAQSTFPLPSPRTLPESRSPSVKQPTTSPSRFSAWKAIAPV